MTEQSSGGAAAPYEVSAVSRVPTTASEGSPFVGQERKLALRSGIVSQWSGGSSDPNRFKTPASIWRCESAARVNRRVIVPRDG